MKDFEDRGVVVTFKLMITLIIITTTIMSLFVGTHAAITNTSIQ